MWLITLMNVSRADELMMYARFYLNANKLCLDGLAGSLRGWMMSGWRLNKRLDAVWLAVE